MFGSDLDQHSLEAMPVEALLEIYKHLTIHDVHSLRSVNQHLKNKSDDIWQSLWKEKFNTHFPHLRITQSDDWYLTFKTAYESEYKNLSKDEKAIISMIKEGKLDEIMHYVGHEKSKIHILLSLLEKKDSSGRMYVLWAPTQEMLDFFYASVLDSYRGAASHIVIPPDWAILCRQPLATLDELITKKNRDVNAKRFDDGSSLLHLAMMQTNTPLDEARDNEVLNYLLSKNANIEQTNNFRKTPIFIAAANHSSLHLVKALKAAGANLKAVDNDGNTVIHAAAASGCIETMQMLLDDGTDINSKNHFGATPFHSAVASGHIQAMKFLLEAKANINVRDHKGNMPLHRAVASGQIEAMNVLLKAGADKNSVNKSDETPIFIAARDASRPHLFQVLVDAGVNLKVVKRDRNDIFNRTAPTSLLHEAVASGHIQAMKILLDRGASIDETSIYLAASHANRAGLQFLISRGADVNRPLSKGNTLLHEAVQENNLNAVIALLEQGADVNALYIRKERREVYASTGYKVLNLEYTSSALGLAFEKKHMIDEKIIEALLKHGADINAAAFIFLPRSGLSPSMNDLVKKYEFIHQIQEIIGEKQIPDKPSPSRSFSLFNAATSLEDDIAAVMKTIIDSELPVTADSDLQFYIHKLMQFLTRNENEKLLNRIDQTQFFEVLDKLNDKNKSKIVESFSTTNNIEMKGINIKLTKMIAILEQHCRSRFYSGNDNVVLSVAKKLKDWSEGKKVSIAPNEVKELDKGQLGAVYKEIQKTAFHKDNKDKLLLGETVFVRKRGRSRSPK